MVSKDWVQHDHGGYGYFEFKAARYSMKCTFGKEQEKFLEASAPVMLQQIHSALIIDIDRDDLRTGDGMVSSDPKKTLGLKIADCLPVFLFNDRAMCAIHCGWRGILAGIVRNARAAMKTYHYVLGACIGPECYEVKRDVKVQFAGFYPAAVKEQNKRFFLDLKAAVIQDLGRGALIADLDMCTMCHPEYFFSYRRGDREKRNYALISRCE